MAGAAGILLLRGQLPGLYRGVPCDHGLLNGTPIDISKRSSRKVDGRWAGGGRGANQGPASPTAAGYANYKVQGGVLEGGLIGAAKAMLGATGDTHTYATELMSRPEEAG